MAWTQFACKIFTHLKDYLHHTFVIRPGDNHWIKFGLLSHLPNQQDEYVSIKRKTVIIFTLLYIINLLLGLLFGWERQWFLKVSGNFWAVFGSEVVWFYCSVLVVLAASQNIVVPIIVRKYWAGDWISLLDDSNIESWCEDISLPRNQALVLKHKMTKFSKYAFWLVNCFVKMIPLLATALFVLYLARYQFSFGVFVVALLNWSHFIATGTPCALYNFIPFAYFVVFCYRTRLILQLIQHDLDSLAKLQFVKPFRFKSRISQDISAQLRLYKLTAHCNHVYRHLTPCTILLTLFASVLLLYVSQQVTFYEQIVVFLMLFAAIILAVTPFLVGNLITFQVNGIERCFQKLACPRFPSRQKLLLPFTTKWHVLLMLECLNSKRHRIGFSCLHWFRLNHTSLVKARIYLY